MAGAAGAGKPAPKAAMGATFFVVFAVVFALLTVAAVNVAIHPQGPGNGRGAGIAGAVLFGAAFCMFTHLALQAEHHWHWHRRGLSSADPTAQIAEAQAQALSTPTMASTDVDTTNLGTPASGTTLPAPHGVFSVGKKHQRHGPIGAVVIAAFLTLFTVFSFHFLFSSISGANRSSEVQKHGIAATVTVVSIHHEEHSSRYSTWYTADITAALPDGGTTIVHDVNDDFDDPGTPLSVLIDPKDHSYAEFPGQPKGNSTNWIIALVFIVVSLAIDAQVIRGAVRMVRRHRGLT